jgi:hypothetical protein
MQCTNNVGLNCNKLYNLGQLFLYIFDLVM